MDSRRIGIISISHRDLVEKQLTKLEAAAIFSVLTPYRQHDDFSRDIRQWIVDADFLRPVVESELIPTYELTLERQDSHTEFTLRDMDQKHPNTELARWSTEGWSLPEVAVSEH